MFLCRRLLELVQQHARCDMNEDDWVERYQWLQTLLNTKVDIRTEFRVWKMALSARLPAFSLATRGVVRRTCWPKHSLVKPLSPSPQLNLHLGPRYATRISIANTLSIALKHYLTGNLTSMDYWILTSVLFLGWFAIWIVHQFLRFEISWFGFNPGCQCASIHELFFNHLLTILVQPGHFQYTFPFSSHLAHQTWSPSADAPLLSSPLST